MQHFISNEPVRVSLPDHPDEWLEIKPALSYADRAYVQGEVYKVDVRLSDGARPAERVAPQLVLRLERAAPALLSVGIVGWRLLDEAGQEIPFSKELLARANPESPLFDLAIQELVRRNPTLLTSQIMRDG